MAAQGATLATEFEEFAAEMVRSGRYASGREVLEAAKAALRREEMEDGLDIELLKQAIDEGDASGIYEGDAFADLRKKYGLPSDV